MQEVSLAALVYEQAVALQRFQAAAARRLGLGLSDLLALEHLSDAPLTPKQLGARLGMTPGAVTALVDRLERSGHLERLPHPDDRRSQLLRRTTYGLEAVLGQIRPLAEEIDGVAAACSPDERAAIARFLQMVTEALERHVGPDTAPAGLPQPSSD